MTYKTSLKIWSDAGILDRELSIYDNHANKGIKVSILSFGKSEDSRLAKKYTNIEILTNKWKLPTWLYAVFVPWLFHSTLKQVDIFKSNQMYGAHVIVWCKLFYKAKVIIRQGYDFVEHAIKKRGISKFLRWLLMNYEKLNFSFSDAAVFSAENMLVDARFRCSTLPQILRVIPNYIDPKVWHPPYKLRNHSSQIRIVYFGRFVAQKNLDSLVRAVVSLPVKLVLIGEGTEQGKLEQLAHQLGVHIEFMQRLPQVDLVRVLRDCDCFVLPSHYEGHPKALIEAMAFGIPVLTTTCGGIAEFVEPTFNCIGMTPTVEGLRKGIETFIALSYSERAQLTKNARNSSLDQYSVKTIAPLERILFDELCSNANRVIQ